MLKFDRAIELLRVAVDHIESFEEDMSSKVLSSLGFTDDELSALQIKIEILPEDKENVIYVDGWDVHNGQVYWILNRAGDAFIFSDEVYAEDCFITECVPFKNYSHYIFEEELANGSTKYIAYAWYNNKESYVEEFSDLNEALDWLVPDLALEQDNSLDDKIRFCESMSKDNDKMAKDNEYYKTSDGFFDFYVNKKSGEKKFKLDEGDVEVDAGLDDFSRNQIER